MGGRVPNQSLRAIAIEPALFKHRGSAKFLLGVAHDLGAVGRSVRGRRGAVARLLAVVVGARGAGVEGGGGGGGVVFGHVDWCQVCFVDLV